MLPLLDYILQESKCLKCSPNHHISVQFCCFWDVVRWMAGFIAQLIDCSCAPLLWFKFVARSKLLIITNPGSLGIFKTRKKNVKSTNFSSNMSRDLCVIWFFLLSVLVSFKLVTHSFHGYSFCVFWNCVCISNRIQFCRTSFDN